MQYSHNLHFSVCFFSASFRRVLRIVCRIIPVFCRIYRFTVQTEFKMQMRACGHSRGANGADLIALSHFLPLLAKDLIHMNIHRAEAIRVFDDNIITICHDEIRFDHGSFSRCKHRSSDRSREIYAGVFPHKFRCR